MGTKLKLPIGIEFFKDIRTRGYYYVDKTGFIQDLLDSCGSVNLFTQTSHIKNGIRTLKNQYFSL